MGREPRACWSTSIGFRQYRGRLGEVGKEPDMGYGCVGQQVVNSASITGRLGGRTADECGRVGERNVDSAGIGHVLLGTADKR